jgi:hypothetical protein
MHGAERLMSQSMKPSEQFEGFSFETFPLLTEMLHHALDITNCDLKLLAANSLLLP